MLPCFFFGKVSTLFSSILNALISFFLVSVGTITSSTYPLRAGSIRVSKLGRILVYLFLKFSLFIFRSSNLFSKNNFSRTLCSHHCNFCHWPCIIQICPNMLRVHYVICTSISLSGNHRNSRYSGF